jgi:hypothetical protein
LHYAIAQLGVQSFSWLSKVGCTEKNRFPDYDCDWNKPKPASAARQGFASAEDPHRHNRRERFSYNQT